MAEMQAVIFDVDGLLLDSEAVYRQSWTEAAASQRFVLSHERYATFIGQRIAWCEEQLAALAGPDFNLIAFRAAWRVGWRAIARHGVAPKPGARELVAALRAHGVPCGLATSSARPEAELSLAAWISDFDAVATGDQVVNGKPAPDIYLLAASRLGIAPERCLALEDSANGARSALAAGMRLIIVPDLVQPPAEVAARAFRVLPSLGAAHGEVLRQLGIDQK